jgi:hypothetical protein
MDRTPFAFGGTLVMLTSLLALFHHPNWSRLTLFIGFNCLQSPFTGFCPPGRPMQKFGMNTGAEVALENLQKSTSPAHRGDRRLGRLWKQQGRRKPALLLLLRALVSRPP